MADNTDTKVVYLKWYDWLMMVVVIVGATLFASSVWLEMGVTWGVIALVWTTIAVAHTVSSIVRTRMDEEFKAELRRLTESARKEAAAWRELGDTLDR